jgi:hypothetical protein
VRVCGRFPEVQYPGCHPIAGRLGQRALARSASGET